MLLESGRRELQVDVDEVQAIEAVFSELEVLHRVIRSAEHVMRRERCAGGGKRGGRGSSGFGTLDGRGIAESAVCQGGPAMPPLSNGGGRGAIGRRPVLGFPVRRFVVIRLPCL